MPKEALEAAPRLLYFLSSCCLDFVGVGLCGLFLLVDDSESDTGGFRMSAGYSLEVC